MRTILKLGKKLSKESQKYINGGTSRHACSTKSECYSESDCISFAANCQFLCAFLSPEGPGMCIGIP
ncbi:MULTISPECIES: hypothetical protein [unclassified Tenacibaculum]|uniref:hypothetical protein n=1 Tax=unclassified Tenacibaculum TaxID=2635139 RepID=UPI001F32A388|nr:MULTISPECIES: hypothetical protein [unclassified Tenacibaculum]MCF2876013.1 hypothetical protein [Tenacibaculum sp. Cn5-1]MCF2936088.1 hypothetical protein [Tenacibaculum sp. Cn5-34]MCG7512649.1 hypothetical protein [Tenacibaculum sp. Cn5-46]